MRSIITGGAGFIGSNLADTLVQHHDVVIIDNLATGPAG
jgi:UDP-glucose 4-epimerase